MAASFATMAVAGGHVAPVLVAAVLLALSQVFYSPSLDVIVTGDARARGLDLGKTMARQLFWQNLGMMGGSLFAGALFDQALRLGTPSLAWSVPAAASIALLAAWALGIRAKRTRTRRRGDPAAQPGTTRAQAALASHTTRLTSAQSAAAAAPAVSRLWINISPMSPAAPVTSVDAVRATARAARP